MKTCPFCAEEIQDAAIVCKHCGRAVAAGAPKKPANVKPQGEASKNELKVGAGCSAVVIVLILAVLGPYWWKSTIGPIFGYYPETKAEEQPQPAKPLTVPLVTTGSAGAHEFWMSKDGATAVVTFKPFLPRDDAAVLGAASEAIAQGGFGTRLAVASARASGRHILVNGANGKEYALLLVKEGTGEVHSIQIEER